MQLDTEFIRLPLRVDAARLAAEVARIPEAAWRPHPHGYAGNSALPLISVNGDPHNDDVAGAMAPTPHLAQLPYLQQVLAAFETVLGRTRLMRLEGDADAVRHSDINYYWFERMRVHVPIVTHPEVLFSCGERALHMAAGEVWIFDTWRAHSVHNPRPTSRIHLVADTVGSAAFGALVDQGARVFTDMPQARTAEREIPFVPGHVPQLAYERWNFPEVMPPAQLDAVVALLLSSLPASAAGGPLQQALKRLSREWRGLWARHGTGSEQRGAFIAVRDRFQAELSALAASVRLINGSEAERALRELLLRPAASSAPVSVVTAPARQPQSPAPQAPAPHSARFERPVFIVCPPRSGSSLLFETLAQSPDLWTIGGESHAAIESIPALHPETHGFASNRLTEADLTDDVRAQLEQAFWTRLCDRDGHSAPPARVRLLEKTPKNTLRIPFLAKAFPDAYFVYLYRDPREVVSSMLEAWRSGRFITYPQLPGWSGPAWSLLLTPEWRALSGKSLPDIVADQFCRSTNQLLDDLEALGPQRYCVAHYAALVQTPAREIARLCQAIGVRFDRALQSSLPHSRTTLTAPSAEKWRANADAIQHMQPRIAETVARAHSFAHSQAAPAARPTAATTPASAAPPPSPAPAELDFRSVYTKSLPELLRRIGATLLVTTYQSGRTILARADGDKLNTHLCAFPSPMGVAVREHQIALGTEREIWEFCNVPELAPRLPVPRGQDAVFVPRRCHVTGDIRVHELAYAENELWFVNTRFSALCTLDGAHSFVPRWKPPFITQLAAEDRCHLNGMCVHEGRVRWVTVLGQTDSKGGWRENKTRGGALLEVPSGRPVVEGLCMPHSPRFYDGQLWLLESGKGTLCRVDPVTRSVHSVAELDGFTRGLTFVGPYAFVGLSQVRESNIFGGIPLVERVPERKCGVWVVDIRNGQTVAFLRFEGTVQEIFDVQLLPQARFAELLEPSSPLLGSTYTLPAFSG